MGKGEQDERDATVDRNVRLERVELYYMTYAPVKRR